MRKTEKKEAATQERNRSRLFKDECVSERRETYQTQKALTIILIIRALSVIRLGLEPRTPTLKVLCSTS